MIIGILIIGLLLLTVWGMRRPEKVQNIQWLKPLHWVLANKTLRQWSVNILGAAFLVWFAMFYMNWIQPALTPADMFPPPFEGPVAVKAAKVATGPVANVASYSGNVEPYESNEVYARVDGFVESMNVYEGDYVKKRELLAQLDLSSLEPRLLKARADSAFWKAELERIAGLYSDSAVTPSEYDRAKMSYQTAVSQVQLARANIDYASVQAGLSGFVAERSIYPGQYVKRGMKIFRIDQLERVRIQFEVSEDDLPFIQVGDPVWLEFPQVSMHAFKRNKEWRQRIHRLSKDEILGTLAAGTVTGDSVTTGSEPPGMLARVAVVFPAEDPQTRTGTVEVRISNPGILLKSQAYVAGKFAVSRVDSAVRVPARAVVRQPDGRTVVFTAPALADQGNTQAREVTTGLSTPEYIQILSGLESDEYVVYSGNKNLSQGQSVMVIERKD